jgi:hypothetical protein
MYIGDTMTLTILYPLVYRTFFLPLAQSSPR